MLGDRLRELRQERSLSQQELADQLKIARGTYAHYELARRDPDTETLQRLAGFFNVSLDYLLGRTDDPRPVERALAEVNRRSKTATIPILGTIRAGVPLLAEDNWEGEVDVPAHLDAEFALRVTGDSMSWVGIHDGDIAALRKTEAPSSGMIVAAGVEDDLWSATLKYFICSNGQAVLRAANPAYQDIKVTDGYRIIGHVVGVLKEPPGYQEYRSLLVGKEVADSGWARVIEIAIQNGLDGDEVANMVAMFVKVSRGGDK